MPKASAAETVKTKIAKVIKKLKGSARLPLSDALPPLADVLVQRSNSRALLLLFRVPHRAGDRPAAERAKIQAVQIWPLLR